MSLPRPLRPPLLSATLWICTLWLATGYIVLFTGTRLEEHQNTLSRLAGEARQLEENIRGMRAALPELMRARAKFDAVLSRSPAEEDGWQRQLDAIAARLGLMRPEVRIGPANMPDVPHALRVQSMQMDLRIVHELDLLQTLAFLAQEGPGVLEERTCQIWRGHAEARSTDLLSARCELRAIMPLLPEK